MAINCWNIIETKQDLQEFLDMVGLFHDSCIKEIRYKSGAFVDESLDMHPINDKRILSLVLQLQNCRIPMIVLEFIGLKKLQLCPVDESYTSEILEASMFFENGCIYWCDDYASSTKDFDATIRTMVCAERCSWCKIDGYMGKEDFFIKKDTEITLNVSVTQ